jgi:hypothetical protein
MGRGRHLPDAVPVNAKTMRALAAESGFRVHSLELLETKPTYLALHPLAYRAGIAYERLVNRFEALARVPGEPVGETWMRWRERRAPTERP